MAKVVVIDLSNSTHNVIWVSLSNPLLPIAVPLLSALTDLVNGNNFVVISRGILGGRYGVGLSDATISAVSPQSGGLIESKVQGRLANSLYSLDIDAVAVINQASSITGIEMELEQTLSVTCQDARKFKGATVWQTTKSVLSHNTLSTLAIGDTGEKENISSSVVGDYGFATSQGGLGAVFGRMNIKYITFKGKCNKDVSPVIADVTKQYLSEISNNPLTKSEYDPPGFGLWANSSLVGYMAGNNFGSNLPTSVEIFEPGSFIPYLKDVGTNSCPGCPQQCFKSYLVDDSPIDGGRQHQLSIAALLSQFGEANTEQLIQFNSYCNQIGVEHLYIASLLSQENLESNGSIIESVDLVKRKKLQTGFNQIKGMAIPPWDPRGNQGLFLAMALNPSGPRYDVIEHDIDFDPNWAWSRHVEYGEEFGIPKGGLPLGTLDSRREQSIADLWLLWSALDAIGVCIYAAPPTRELKLADILKILSFQLNKQITRAELFEIGLMRLAFQRDMNDKLGVSVKSDTLPDLFFNTSINSKGAKLDGAVINKKQFENMKSHILNRLFWNEEGGVNKSTEIWRKCEVEFEIVRSKIL